ncbi:MAG: hypothetical protein H0W70_15215 [Actinobacteria bacterium]|nr:hypothetical protein [Actinomycetota bacterium]
MRRLARGATATTNRRGVAWTATPYECGVRLGDAAAADDVIAVLHDLRDPNGDAVVASVRRRTDVYTGPYVARAPDLLVEMADEAVDLHDGFHAPAPWLDRNTEPWGTHRVEGVVAVSGAAMTAKGEAADVAASVLDLLGLHVDGLDGRSLVAATDAHVHRDVDPSLPASADTAYSDEEEAAVLEHLRGLGYVE